jgi:hypothetical protein
MPIARVRHRDLHLQRPTINKQKSVFQNLIMKLSYGPRKIFLPAFICLGFPNMAISFAKPYVVALGAGLAGKPMGAQT